MTTMRAVLFEGQEQLRVADVPRPECGPGEVLLRIAACGICGGDARSYFNVDAFTGKVRIPGHEMTGVVTQVGEYAPWRVGDRLALAADIHCGHCWYCQREHFNVCDTLRILGKHLNGGLAEYMLLTRDILEHGIVNRVPDDLSLQHAAISEPLCSVLATHDDLAIQEGETVAVLGPGPMGILHHELLQARGARVILIGRSPKRLERARRDFNVQCIVDGSTEDVIERVRALTNGVGADVAICAAPSPSAVQQATWLVRKRGRIGLFGGLPVNQREVPLDINRIHYGELQLVGNFSYHPRQHQRALDLLASGAIDCDRLITTYSLDQTRQGLHDIRDGNVMKAVVTMEPTHA